LEAVPSSIRILTRSFQIQLAAVRKETAAQNEWRRLKARHRTLLSNLELNVVKADLGTKGIYFRLRAGPLKDAESAKTLCRELSKVKVRCLVIRPEK
ncbi:MAG: SPOR domain-containing protein, partial [Rhodospirillales bacterium]